MLKKDKSLVGKKVKSRFNEDWYWNGATVIDVTEREYGQNYYLLEKNGNSTWTSQNVIEVL